MLKDEDIHTLMDREYSGLEGGFLNNVNPVSMDLLLGSTIKEWKPKKILGFPFPSKDYVLTVHKLVRNSAFRFLPGRFYLAHSVEYLRMPNDVAAEVKLKSSTARKGLDHLNAGLIEPDFHGQVTLEFVAHKPVYFITGEPIVQLVFHYTGIPKRSYLITGRYNGQTGPEEVRAPIISSEE